MFESDNNENLSDSIKSSQEFKDSKNMEELIYHNIEYLNGNHYSSCYTNGPIKSETIIILNYLLEINRLGFITVKSYNGSKNPIQCYNKCHTNKQRSYIRGLVKKDNYAKIKNYLKSKNFVVINHQKISKDHPIHYTLILNNDLWIQSCICEQFYIKNIDDYDDNFKDSYECFSECKNVYNQILNDYYDISIMDLDFARPFVLFDEVIQSLI
jgi:hypothetical protein